MTTRFMTHFTCLRDCFSFQSLGKSTIALLHLLSKAHRVLDTVSAYLTAVLSTEV